MDAAKDELDDDANLAFNFFEEDETKDKYVNVVYNLFDNNDRESSSNMDVIVDSAATISVFSNAELLSNIRDAEKPIINVKGIGGNIHEDE